MESTFNARYVIAFRLESVTFDDQMDYKSAAPQDYRNGADMCLFHFYSSLLLLALVLVLFVLLSLIKQSNRFSRNHFRTAHIFGVLTECHTHTHCQCERSERANVIIGRNKNYAYIYDIMLFSEYKIPNPMH